VDATVSAPDPADPPAGPAATLAHPPAAAPPAAPPVAPPAGFRGRRTVLGLVGAVAAGVALLLSFPPYGLWWLAPVGVALLAAWRCWRSPRTDGGSARASAWGSSPA